VSPRSKGSCCRADGPVNQGKMHAPLDLALVVQKVWGGEVLIQLIKNEISIRFRKTDGKDEPQLP
jgi:hypothetical protein